MLRSALEELPVPQLDGNRSAIVLPTEPTPKPRRSGVMTHKKMCELIRQGRGTGHGRNYLPWLMLRRKNSSPDSNQVVSWMSPLQRTAHYFSRGEKSPGDLGGARGRLISVPDRLLCVELIREAEAAGSRLAPGCDELGITLCTFQRWVRGGDAAVVADSRSTAVRPEPANKLSEGERAEILAVVNSEEFCSLPPSRIVPALADRGVYVASESSFYRVLKAASQQHHRGRAKKPCERVVTSHCASGPNQVWSWDITWLPTVIKGQFYYWYMVLDIFSRKIVGHEVHVAESAESASRLMRRTSLAEGLAGRSLVLHSDNGSAMKGATMLATLEQLGVAPSFSRPRVSNDNAYAESLFRTCKYRPDYPGKPFGSLEEAQAWTQKFVRWYNQDHKHSGLKFVTPAQRHCGQDAVILKRREQVYREARNRNPQRWSRDIRNWKLDDQVC